MSDLSYYGEKAQQQNEKQQKQYVVRRNSTQSTSKQNVSVVLEDNASESNELPKGFILYASLIALALSLFLAALDIMIVSTIIEEVAKQFGSYSEIGWLFTGYSLPNALLALIWGRIATPIGFKETMLFAIVIFEIGSLISALANSMSMLIGGRVIAGVGGCGIQSLSFVIGSTLVEESQRGILIAVLSCSFAIASVVNLALGASRGALFLTCAGYISQFTYIVQYFQLIYNDSAWRAAVHLVACIISTVVTAILCGVITDKTRQIKPIIVISSIFGVVGAGILTLLNNNANNSAHIGLLILPGVAFGGLAQSSMLASQIQLDKKSPTFRSDFVSITTFNTFCKNLGQALGGVISNTVFSAAAIKKLTKANIQLPDGTTVDNLVIYRQTNFDGSFPS
ncbi:BEM_HP_G0113740.mRNA.1.CDS.1 [Saccharomyces cerevisiae]|nr:BEM_HP_G0113740.mRNA.1.CDS.1 [Saccharomyces cerevisiae]CAI7013689.1 BEM_HP_G0113740.mRNA.1.CDS.1 [Saccharomyces cerevisiae]